MVNLVEGTAWNLPAFVTGETLSVNVEARDGYKHTFVKFIADKKLSPSQYEMYKANETGLFF